MRWLVAEASFTDQLQACCARACFASETKLALLAC